MRDPIIKTDGQGNPVRLSETGLNRAERRALLKEERRHWSRAERRQRQGKPLSEQEARSDG